MDQELIDGLPWSGLAPLKIILNNMMDSASPPSQTLLSHLRDKISGSSSRQFFFTITLLVGSDTTWEQSAEAGEY